MEINVISLIIACSAAFVGILGLIDRYYGSAFQFRNKVAERLTALEGRKIDPEILQRIVALETKTGPFWRVLEEHMVDLLKQPTHKRMDDLLDDFKYRREVMTLDELVELKCEIKRALDENMTEQTKRGEGRTFGYVVMLGILEYRISTKAAQEERAEHPERGNKECTKRTTT